jgi:nitrate/nitrite transporter NarK
LSKRLSNYSRNFLQQKYNYNEADAGRITSLIGLFSTILSPALGWALDKWGKHGFVASFGSLSMALLFCVFIFHEDYSVFVISGIGISYALVQASIWPCMVVVVDDDYFGTAYGLTLAITNLCCVFANWYIGNILAEHVEVVALIWATLSAIAFLLSLVWNVLDTTTGGVANSPADDEEVEEEDEEDDESEGLLN